MADTSGLLSAYLVMSSDELFCRRTLERIKKRLDPAFYDFNYGEISASAETTADTLLSLFNTYPVCDSLRVSVVYEPEKLPADVLKAVVSYLAHPNESTTVLFVSSGIKKSSSLYKAIEKLGKQAIISSGQKKGKEMVRHVQNMAKAYGLTMDYDAADCLLGLVGSSGSMLDARLKDLSDLAGDRRSISADFVKTWVSRLEDPKPWVFLDALFGKNLSRALDLYSSDTGSPLRLLTLMEGRLRELIYARCLAAKNMSTLLAQDLKKQDWQVRGLSSQALRYKEFELEDLLGLCADTERALKTGADADTRMLTLIARICQGS